MIKIWDTFWLNCGHWYKVLNFYQLLYHRPQNKGRSAVNDRQILHLDHRKSLICDQGDRQLFCNESCTQVNSDR